VAGAFLLLALLDGVLCARAGLGRTGSWSFPIDDAYIYSNYVLAAEAGHPFEYNPGERSGGVTGVGWMLLLWAAHPLTGVLGDAPATLAPAGVRAVDLHLAVEAGRLYMTAYALGGLLLAGAALAVAALARECYRGLPRRGALLTAVAVGFALLADQNVVWAAYSGLEIPLSLLLVALAPALLLRELRGIGGRRDGGDTTAMAGAGGRGLSLRWSLVTAGLLPWARPELAVVGLAAGAWLCWGAWRDWATWRAAGAYLIAVGVGLAALMSVFMAYTGRPLPSSFYAKVSGVRFDTLTAALQEWVAARAWPSFALLVLAALGALAVMRSTRMDAGRRDGGGTGVGYCPAGLPALCAVAYFGAMLVAVRWFGQEDRYILPIHALALPLAAAPLALLLAQPSFASQLARLGGRCALALGAGLTAVALAVQIGATRQWAATDYALFVQNIEDAHVAPSLWLAAHAAPGSTLAAEPIGAIRLFSGHPTVDIVGLTTPSQLGHYGDWAATAGLLGAHGAEYLLYYPRWWPSGKPLAWAQEAARFPVPGNRMAGDDLIAVYSLVWK